MTAARRILGALAATAAMGGGAYLAGPDMPVIGVLLGVAGGFLFCRAVGLYGDGIIRVPSRPQTRAEPTSCWDVGGVIYASDLGEFEVLFDQIAEIVSPNGGAVWARPCRDDEGR